MPQTLLPALHAALLELVEGKEQGPACRAHRIDERVDMGACEMILRRLREPDAANADIHGLAAQIAERLIVTRRRPQKCRKKCLRRHREMRQLLQLSANRDDQRAQIEIADIAAVVEDL